MILSWNKSNIYYTDSYRNANNYFYYILELFTKKCLINDGLIQKKRKPINMKPTCSNGDTNNYKLSAFYYIQINL